MGQNPCPERGYIWLGVLRLTELLRRCQQRRNSELVQSATKTPSFLNCGIDKRLSQKSHKLPYMGSNPIPAIFYLIILQNINSIKG
jgi:hypothetical protein